jgi:hypothetical protein
MNYSETEQERQLWQGDAPDFSFPLSAFLSLNLSTPLHFFLRFPRFSFPRFSFQRLPFPLSTLN